MTPLAYVSTRGGVAAQRFCDTALDGLAADGGLMLPERLPQVSQAELLAWRDLSYADLAFEVMRRFVDDIEPVELKELLTSTYQASIFGSDAVTPLTRLDDRLALLHLSNGPTLAFKDLAMQWLGRLFEHLLKKRGQTLNIVGATSGDTGSAALAALAGKSGVNVFMLSPYQRMSPFQAAQMYSVSSSNCHNLVIRGVFDQAQDIVKAINQDAEFKSRWRIGTVNSINWARLVAQVVYYFRGYFAATKSNAEKISFCVPSGNFGNIYAGHVARRMGLPIDRLICATNENDVLHEFFQSGCYRARSIGQVVATSSPSMDISRASNFERLVFDLYRGDGSRVVASWRQLADSGSFLVDRALLARTREEFGFESGASSHALRLEAIRDAHRRFGVFIDPHTADGYAVAARAASSSPIVILETAKPAKFEATMQQALGFVPPRPAAFEGLEQRPQRFQVIDADAEIVRDQIVLNA
jgi:threonine synthase